MSSTFYGSDGGAFAAATEAYASKDGVWHQVPLGGGGGGCEEYPPPFDDRPLVPFWSDIPANVTSGQVWQTGSADTEAGLRFGPIGAGSGYYQDLSQLNNFEDNELFIVSGWEAPFHSRNFYVELDYRVETPTPGAATIPATLSIASGTFGTTPVVDTAVDLAVVATDGEFSTAVTDVGAWLTEPVGWFRVQIPVVGDGLFYQFHVLRSEVFDSDTGQPFLPAASG